MSFVCMKIDLITEAKHKIIFPVQNLFLKLLYNLRGEAIAVKSEIKDNRG